MERFLTTPLEEREKLEQMKSLNARLLSNETVIAKLEKELNDATAERDLEVGCFFSFHICRLLMMISFFLHQKNTHIKKMS